MTNEEVEQIIRQQGEAAASRQSQLNRLITTAFAFVIAITIVFGGIIFYQSRTINDLSETINRRSPILEYLECHDSIQASNDDLLAKRNAAQTRYVLGLVDLGETPNEAALIKVSELRRTYDKSEEAYQKAVSNKDELKACGEFPEGD